MKQIYLFMALCILFAGCQSESENENKNEQKEQLAHFRAHTGTGTV